ncbi:MAG: flippase-like domain-containing protein [Rhodospirillales bacterium]|nr:flippase-like domain-containing protein [Rhodospirillales bacterium]
MAEHPGPEPVRLKSVAWRWRQALVGIAIGAALFALTTQRAPIGAIAESLRALDFSWAALALLAYAADLGLRVIRWRLLFAKVAPLPVATFARALLVGYGLNILLPARLGELARIEYLKLRTETRRSTAIPGILVERAMDGLAVLGALALGLIAARHAGVGSPLLTGLIGGGAAMVAALVAAPLTLRGVPDWIAGRLPVRAQESLGRAHAALAAMDGLTLTQAGLITIAIYLAEISALAAMLQAVGAPPTPVLMLVLLGAASLSTLLPTAPGFLGSYQLAYALVFELFGRSPVLGAAAATAVQAVLFAPVVLAALVLVLAPQRKNGAASSSSPPSDVP